MLDVVFVGSFRVLESDWMIRVRCDWLWCLATLGCFKAIETVQVLRIQGRFGIVELFASETDHLQQKFQANFSLKAQGKGRDNENYSQMLILGTDNVKKDKTYSFTKML